MRWRWKRTVDPDRGSSMALLDEVLDRPPDPGYQSAAAERSSQGLPPSTGSRSPLLLVSALLLGFLLAVAAQSLRAPDPATARTRAGLIERIEASQALGDQRVTAIEELRQEVAALESRALEGGTGQESQRIRDAGIQAGAVAMVGPGVVLTLDDAPVEPDAEPGSQDAEARVFARDLQTVVNGLWANGAEAVAINEQRLTATSSIRFAGEAIIVDFRGLTRPYVVSAIGDPGALGSELDTGTTGDYLAELADRYGIVVQLESPAEVNVPAAARLGTRVADVAPPEGPDTTPNPTQEDPG